MSNFDELVEEGQREERHIPRATEGKYVELRKLKGHIRKEKAKKTYRAFGRGARATGSALWTGAKYTARTTRNILTSAPAKKVYSAIGRARVRRTSLSRGFFNRRNYHP